ncbi:unnamed protein product [Rhizophagus irregularis]|nr:unnamed protein product [Rhizophagus irregularis]
MPPKRKAVQLTLIERSEPVPRSKGERPQDPVWTHFIQTPLATAGHFAAEYDESNKHQKLDQLNITDFWNNEHNKALSKPRQDSMDQSLIKMKGFIRKYTKDLKIEGGGLKSWVETQWTTMFESADSIWRLKLALEKVPHYFANKNSNIITSKSVLKSINARDCFIALIRLANAIEQIPVERGLVGFRNHAIDSINRHWESFDNMPFILTYFLHPGYRGEELKQGMWTKISAYAQDIWKNMGYDINDQEILIAQMLNFKDK